MRLYFFFFLIFLSFTYGLVSEEYCQEIQVLTEEINSYPKHLCPAELRNERGLFFFLSQEYDKAIEDFENVAERFENNAIEDCSLYASALWGRFLTYAFTNDINKSLSDLFLIRKLFIDSSCNFKKGNSSCIVKFDNNFSAEKIADFADPNDRLTPEQCKERVRGTAIAMRALCLKIPNSTLRFATEISIGELEQKAYTCCDKEHWTECLSPIVDAWNYLKESMDKGVRYAPYVLFPSSNIQPEKLQKTRKEVTHV